MPASTSSNTSVAVSGPAVWAPESTSRNASMERASSPPEATRLSGSSGETGVRCEEESHPIAGVILDVFADFHGDGCVRHGEQPQPFLDRSRERLGGGPTGPAHVGRSDAFDVQPGATLLVELGSSLLVRLEFAQPVLGFGVVRHDRSEIVAVLASQVRKELATFTHGIEALG